MEHCLQKIADQLNQNVVTWAIGASMLLYYHGLVAKPNDIDLLVSPGDIVLTNEILCGLGVKSPQKSNQGYGTRYFSEYRIDGVEVDVMADFTIHYQDGSYRYYLNPAVLTPRQVANTCIYLCPLEDWLVLYLCMEREERASVIERYLRHQGSDRRRLRFWQNEPLPAPILSKIQSFL